MEETIEDRIKKELNSLVSIRQSLDSMLNDMKRYTAIIISLDRRVKLLEDKLIEKVIDEELQKVSMYG